MAAVGRAYLSVPAASIGGVDATEPLGLVYALGVIPLAIGSPRARKLPGWVPLAWLASVAVALGGIFVPAFEVLALHLGAVILGAGFVGAGYALWRMGSVEPTARTP